MRRAGVLAALGACLALPLSAQGITFEPLPPLDDSYPTLEISPISPAEAELPQFDGQPILETSQQAPEPVEDPRTAVSQAPGGVLRALDRVSGELTDIALLNGAKAQHGALEITLGECRFPTDDPASDAFAYVTIHDTRHDEQLFEGWMIASSPALNALDHARYDVWVMRCTSE